MGCCGAQINCRVKDMPVVMVTWRVVDLVKLLGGYST